MKTLFLFLILMSSAYAAPVFNKNVASDGTNITIWPDHSDPNHFYYAPNFMKLSSDEKGNYKFHFTQYKTGKCNNRISRALGHCHYKAIISSLLSAGYESTQLAQAQAGIKKLVPGARFSPIPFLSSQVEFGKTLREFIEQNDCSPKAGQAADEIPCSITLNRLGIAKLMNFLNEGKALVFQFDYKVSGVIEVANAQYKDAYLDFGLTVNLGGEMLINHPELNSGYIWEE